MHLQGEWHYEIYVFKTKYKFIKSYSMLVSLRRTKVKKANTFQFICMCVQGLAGVGVIC